MTRRRMSAMLRVICATSGSLPARCAHCVSPTRIEMPLSSRVAVRTGSASRGSSPSASAFARSVSVTSWPSATSTFAPRVSGRLTASSRRPKASSTPSVPVSSPSDGVLGQRGQRQRRAAVVLRARRGDGLEPRAERIGRRRLGRAREAVRADPDAAPQRLGPEAREPPAATARSAAAAAPAGAGPSAASRRGGRPRGRSPAGRASARARCRRSGRSGSARGRGRRAAARSRPRTRAGCPRRR